jgi:hypothetical protein
MHAKQVSICFTGHSFIQVSIDSVQELLHSNETGVTNEELMEPGTA